MAVNHNSSFDIQKTLQFCLNSNLLSSCFIFTVVFIVYLHGVSSQLLIDDYRVLPNLEYGEANNFSGALNYIQTTEGGGPLGRPVVLLSFYFQKDSWPNHPEHFRLFNVVIHAVNSVLVYFVVLTMFRYSNSVLQSYSARLAIFVALAWGFNTIQVSTVLYIVQRMVLLQATFSILSILCYLRIRDELKRNNFFGKRSLLYIFAISLFLVLSILSKETGAMTVLYILIIEKIWFCNDKDNTSKLFNSILISLFLYLLYISRSNLNL